MLLFATRTAALRCLMDISADAVKHAKDLITERNDGKFYFDEDAAEQFLNTQDDLTNANLENTMTTIISLENLKTVATSELVAFYNDHAESSVKKFRDRATAEKKVQIILEALAAEAPVAKPEPMIGNMTLADTVAFAKAVAEKKAKPAKTTKSVMGEMLQALIHDPKMTPPEVREAAPVAYIMPEVCPHCGINLDNGVGEHMQKVTGNYIRHNQFEYQCLACGAEFGPAIKTTKASSGDRQVSDTQAETMKTTLKLDRTIVYIASGETWKNAFQMWKANPTWMTSAQQDGLTAKLYKAAKEGKQIQVVINSRAFQLKNV